jgi:hypothetical protein
MMTDEELNAIVAVLMESPADDTCRTQLGLLLYREMSKQRDQLRRLIIKLVKNLDVSTLDLETQNQIKATTSRV